MPTSVMVALCALAAIAVLACASGEEEPLGPLDSCDVARRELVRPAHRQEQYVCQECLATFALWESDAFGGSHDLVPSVCPRCGRQIARIIDVGDDAR